MVSALPCRPRSRFSLGFLATAAPWTTPLATVATLSAGPAKARDYRCSNSSTGVLPVQPLPVPWSLDVYDLGELATSCRREHLGVEQCRRFVDACALVCVTRKWRRRSVLDAWEALRFLTNKPDLIYARSLLYSNSHLTYRQVRCFGLIDFAVLMCSMHIYNFVFQALIIIQIILCMAILRVVAWYIGTTFSFIHYVLAAIDRTSKLAFIFNFHSVGVCSSLLSYISFTRYTAPVF